MKINSKNDFRNINLLTLIALWSILFGSCETLKETPKSNAYEYSLSLLYKLPYPSFMVQGETVLLDLSLESTLKILNKSDDTIKFTPSEYILFKINKESFDTIVFNKNSINEVALILPYDSVFLTFTTSPVFKEYLKTESDSFYIKTAHLLQNIEKKYITYIHCTNASSSYPLLIGPIVYSDSVEYSSQVKRVK
jgi:hypothetical protein